MSRNKLLSILWFALLCAGGVFAISCTRQVEEGPPALVAALPLTGDLAFLGTPGKVALDIAVRDARARNMPLRVEFADTKADPKETATIIRRELDVRRNRFFLVTLSAPSLAAKAAVSPGEAAVLSVSIHPDVPSADHPIARFCVSAAQEGELLVQELLNSEKSVGLVVSRDAATTVEVEKTILPGLDRAGRAPQWVEWFDVGQRDFKNLAARFAARPVSRVLLLGYGSDFPAALGALATARAASALEIIGGIGFVELGRVPDGFTSDQFRFLAPAFSLGLGGPEAEAFRRAYLEATGKVAPYDAAYAYDAAMTFAGAQKSGHDTPSKVIDFIRGGESVGVTGRIAWDERGEAATEIHWGTFSAAGAMIPVKAAI